MPTLNWIGKDKVTNHHHDVPFRVLDFQYSHGESDAGNMIVHGDNLDALKALLPKYEGRIKCVYIDPPYNTGNEGWVYNDNVNDPKIRKWLGEVVGREGEDLSRHDKWLCMMYPRLKLLQQLLTNDGAIFISLDDNEQANMKLLCDEIFGAANFYAQIIVQSNVRGHTYRQIAKTHEYVLVYTKSYLTEFNEIPKDSENSDLNLLDAIGKFNIRELRNRNPKFGRFNRPNLYYPFYVKPCSEDSNGLLAVSLTKDNEYSIEIFPKNSKGDDSCWRWGTTLSSKNINENTMHSNLVAKKVRTGGYNIYEKYRKESVKAKTIWFDVEFITERGTVELGQLDLSQFEYPKPVSLIERILQLATNPDDLILDSFAGSGTTAHAVLNLNAQDGGNRKFICIEMMDYAETITAERVRRVVDGYADKPGTGSGFNYYELGEPLLLPDGNLNENISDQKIYEYIWFTETKTAYTPHDGYHLGTQSDTAYFFYYLRDSLTVLDAEFLQTHIAQDKEQPSQRYVIYADMCAFDQTDLERFNIVFKKIPRDISRL